MTKNKPILYLSALAVLQLVIYLVLRISGAPTAEVKYLVEVDTSKVSEMSIYHDGTTVTLKRGADTWEVTNPYQYPANNRFVKTLLEKLSDMRIESEVTSNKGRFSEFEVDTAGTRVTLYQSGDRSDFILGKTASGYRQTYARLENEDTIYMIRGSYGTAANRKADAWREKKVSDFEEADVVKVTTPNLTLVRENQDDWRVTDDKGESFVADQSKGKRIPSSLSRLRTSDFPEADDYKAVNFNKPLHSFRVDLKSGDFRDISFYSDPADSNKYFMKYHKKPHVFRVFKGTLNNLLKKPDELKADPDKAPAQMGQGQPQLDPAQMKALQQQMNRGKKPPRNKK